MHLNPITLANLTKRKLLLSNYHVLFIGDSHVCSFDPQNNMEQFDFVRFVESELNKRITDSDKNSNRSFVFDNVTITSSSGMTSEQLLDRLKNLHVVHSYIGNGDNESSNKESQGLCFDKTYADFVVISVGLNDILKDDGPNVQKYVDNMKQILKQVFSLCPDSAIAISEIPIIGEATDSSVQQIVKQYNLELKNLIENFNNNELKQIQEDFVSSLGLELAPKVQAVSLIPIFEKQMILLNKYNKEKQGREQTQSSMQIKFIPRIQAESSWYSSFTSYLLGAAKPGDKNEQENYEGLMLTVDNIHMNEKSGLIMSNLVASFIFNNMQSNIAARRLGEEKQKK
jgi:lysophospholipase L1-like esterase